MRRAFASEAFLWRWSLPRQSLRLPVPSFAPTAFAAKKYQPIAQIPPEYPGKNQSWIPAIGQLLAESVAVSNKNGHIYVADSGRGKIYDYSSTSDKEPAVWNGENTPKESFGGEHLSIAIDNTSGDVYVADRAHAVIDKFDENGNLIEYLRRH